MVNSKNTIVVKRGKGTGFAGIENALFYADNTRMLYDDGAEAARLRALGGRGCADMMLAHRIALAPNNVPATHLSRVAGTARFAYNWALAQWKQQYEAWKQEVSKQQIHLSKFNAV